MLLLDVKKDFNTKVKDYLDKTPGMPDDLAKAIFNHPKKNLIIEENVCNQVQIAEKKFGWQKMVQGKRMKIIEMCAQIYITSIIREFKEQSLKAHEKVEHDTSMMEEVHDRDHLNQ